MFRKWFRSNFLSAIQLCVAVLLIQACATSPKPVDAPAEQTAPQVEKMVEATSNEAAPAKDEPKKEESKKTEAPRPTDHHPTPAQSPKADKEIGLKTTPSSKDASALPEVLKEIEDKYAEKQTLVADFTQTKWVKALDQKKQSSGLISVKRPHFLKWETKEPDQNLMVSNGKKFWFYTPGFDASEKGQVIIRKTSEINTGLATSLLGGAFSKEKNLRIEKKSDKTFLFFPKKGSAGDVEKIEVSLNLQERLIEKVKLFHRGGNETLVALKKIRLGDKLDEKDFNFEIPPGAEIVK